MEIIDFFYLIICDALFITQNMTTKCHQTENVNTAKKARKSKKYGC